MKKHKYDNWAYIYKFWILVLLACNTLEGSLVIFWMSRFSGHFNQKYISSYFSQIPHFDV